MRIHCFHTGKDEASRETYEKLATENDGVFMQLESQSSIGEVMPILMSHLNDKEEVLAVDAKDPEARKLARLLSEPDKPEKS